MSVCPTVGDRRGAVLVLLLFWLPVLMTGAALILDGGQMLLARGRLQAAADLAALAAVQCLDWDLLAEGEVIIIADEAEAAARHYLADNLAALAGEDLEQSEVWVVNASREMPRAHPLTGEELSHPTVILRCHVRAPSSWFGSWRHSSLLEAEADASLRPRGDD